MKVKELIEKLSEFDEESEVVFEAWDYFMELYIDRVEIHKWIANGEESVVIDLEIR